MNTDTLPTSLVSREERLEGLLQRRLGNRIRDLRVLFLDDALILEGWTATYHAKQLAQVAAMEMCDAVTLANNIEVR